MILAQNAYPNGTRTKGHKMSSLTDVTSKQQATINAFESLFPEPGEGRKGPGIKYTPTSEKERAKIKRKMLALLEDFAWLEGHVTRDGAAKTPRKAPKRRR